MGTVGPFRHMDDNQFFIRQFFNLDTIKMINFVSTL
jgi:hypothetical protein